MAMAGSGTAQRTYARQVRFGDDYKMLWPGGKNHKMLWGWEVIPHTGCA